MHTITLNQSSVNRSSNNRAIYLTEQLFYRITKVAVRQIQREIFPANDQTDQVHTRMAKIGAAVLSDCAGGKPDKETCIRHKMRRRQRTI